MPMVNRPTAAVPNLPIHDIMTPQIQLPHTEAIHSNPYAAGVIGRAMHDAVSAAVHTGTPPRQLGAILRGILQTIKNPSVGGGTHPLPAIPPPPTSVGGGTHPLPAIPPPSTNGGT